jgi:hypothetical protein
MAVEASLSSLLSRLEAQMEVHRERERFHAEQEAHHRRQRELHAAELETFARSVETLRAAAETAEQLASRPGAPARLLEGPAPDPNPGGRPLLSRMVALVVESWPAGQPFGASAVTWEVRQRYREKLRRPPDPRMVSLHLRRLLASGRIDSVSPGRPHHEAMYRRKG